MASPVSREALEAVIRRQLARVAAAHRPAFTARTAIMNEATEEILGAAESYALTEYGITADRRRALADATAPIHWQKPGASPGVAICHGRHTSRPVTTEPGEVTCAPCMRSNSWRAS